MTHLQRIYVIFRRSAGIYILEKIQNFVVNFVLVQHLRVVHVSVTNYITDSSHSASLRM